MKKLLILMFAAVAISGACKKEDSPKTTADSSWTLNGTTYKAMVSNKGATSGGTVTTLINFWDAVPTTSLKVNSLALSFFESPTTSGTYQLVGVGAAKTAKQFELSAGTTAPLYYAYIGSAVDVTVTVTAGKVKVVIPEVTLKCTTSNPDVKLTASVQEM
jgi:hypothetical protein